MIYMQKGISTIVCGEEKSGVFYSWLAFCADFGLCLPLQDTLKTVHTLHFNLQEQNRGKKYTSLQSTHQVTNKDRWHDFMLLWKSKTSFQSSCDQIWIRPAELHLMKPVLTAVKSVFNPSDLKKNKQKTPISTCIIEEIFFSCKTQPL